MAPPPARRLMFYSDRAWRACLRIVLRNFRSSKNYVNHDKQPDASSSGTTDDSKKRKSNKIVKLFLKGGKAIRKVCMGLGDALEQYDAKIQAEALTPRELLTATRSVQKAHKYNVLGDKYSLLSSKYKTGSFLGSGNYGKVSPAGIQGVNSPMLLESLSIYMLKYTMSYIMFGFLTSFRATLLRNSSYRYMR